METTRRMRWLELNAGLIRQVIADIAMYSVGSGIKVQAQSGSDAWDDMAESYFKKWVPEQPTLLAATRSSRSSTSSAASSTETAKCLWSRPRVRTGCRNYRSSSRTRLATPRQSQYPGMVDGILFGPYGAPEYYNVIRSDGSSRRVPGQCNASPVRARAGLWRPCLQPPSAFDQ